jgi:hypothetical protein
MAKLGRLRAAGTPSAVIPGSRFARPGMTKALQYVARMEPSGHAFGVPKDKLREIRGHRIRRAIPGLRGASSGLPMLQQ